MRRTGSKGRKGRKGRRIETKADVRNSESETTEGDGHLARFSSNLCVCLCPSLCFFQRTSSTLRSLSSILSSLESPLYRLVTSAVHDTAVKNPYVRLQKWLMMGEYAQAEEDAKDGAEICETRRPAASSSASSSVDALSSSYLLFVFHVYLYLHPACPHGEPLNPTGHALLHSYLRYLESYPSFHPLIPAYAQYLSSDERVEYFIRFLSQLPSLEERQAMLAKIAEYAPENQLDVTKGVVEKLMKNEQQTQPHTALPSQPHSDAQMEEEGEEPQPVRRPPLPSPTAAHALPEPSAIPSLDLEKIRSLDCFDFDSALAASSVPSSSLRAFEDVVLEALNAATALYRSFVLSGNFDAAKKLAEHLSERNWEQYTFQAMKRMQTRDQEDGGEEKTKQKKRKENKVGEKEGKKTKERKQTGKTPAHCEFWPSPFPLSSLLSVPSFQLSRISLLFIANIWIGSRLFAV
jgi:hypothetical protein